jgi:negative regulator of flagellin synthesis FlgM
MHVYGPVQLHGPQHIGAPHSARASRPVEPAAGSPIQDELQISDAAQFVDQMRDLPDVRMDKVAQIKAQIANGTYETADKVDIALDRLLDEIG